MDKPDIELGRGLNSRSGCVHDMLLPFFETKLPKLKLRIRHKQPLDPLLLNIVPPQML
jgi:hypothetical protein